MRKIRIFTDNDSSTLEDEINEWLAMVDEIIEIVSVLQTEGETFITISFIYLTSDEDKEGQSE